jgi:hypothetical protein
MTSYELNTLKEYKKSANRYYESLPDVKKPIIGRTRWERRVLRSLDRPAVNNYSSRVLSETELNTLSLNLKYIPKVKVPFDVHAKEWNAFDRTIQVKNHFLDNETANKVDPDWLDLTLRNKIWIPRSDYQTDIFNLREMNIGSFIDNNQIKGNNIMKDMNSLLNDPNITICDADKNLGVTIVDTTWYLGEIEDQLNDTNTYEVKDPSIDHITERINTCAFWIKKLIHPKVAKYVLDFTKPEVWKLPKFRIIPKIHKDPMKGRPIVPSHHWLTTGLSQVLDRLLRPVLEKCQYVLKDSRELVKLLENLKFENDVILATSDVTSLYTNIDIDDCIKRVLYMHWRHSPRDKHQEQTLLRIGLETILKENYFVSPNGKVYHQLRGLAMGTPIAPLLANIYMYSLEIERLGANRVQPILYKRYIDDIIMIFDRKDEKNIDGYLERITERANSLTFTTTINESKIEFLDLVIYKGIRYKSNKILDLRTHEKELNKYLYIPWSSGHPKHLKKGFIKAEAIRHARNCSDEGEYKRKLFLFKHRLLRRGYKERFVESCFNEVEYGNRDRFINGVNRENSNNLYFPITYSESLKMRNLKDAMMRKLHEFQVVDSKWRKVNSIILSLKSRRNLRQIVNCHYSKYRYTEAKRTEARLKGTPFNEDGNTVSDRPNYALPVRREMVQPLGNNNFTPEVRKVLRELIQNLTDVNQGPPITVSQLNCLISTNRNRNQRSRNSPMPGSVERYNSTGIIRNENNHTDNNNTLPRSVPSLGNSELTSNSNVHQTRNAVATNRPYVQISRNRHINQNEIIDSPIETPTRKRRYSENIQTPIQTPVMERDVSDQIRFPIETPIENDEISVINSTRQTVTVEISRRSLSGNRPETSRTIGRFIPIDRLDDQRVIVDLRRNLMETDVNSSELPLSETNSHYRIDHNTVSDTRLRRSRYNDFPDPPRTYTLNTDQMIRGWMACGRRNFDYQNPRFHVVGRLAEAMGIDRKYVPYMSNDERFALVHGVLRLPYSHDR